MRNNRKTSEAQRKADKRWREKNREHANYLKNRTSARCFIRNKATLEDIEELRELLRLRAEVLSKENNLLC
ncbi:MAG: hypothetical protein KIC66_00810 [Clostridium sp.]|uniref:Uncharacterized protein n=1 Tax=Clostridium paraputrificum TaxID=29363 RepID=A0A6N3GTC7_9CLOT|nr:hypothetical protein [Clostridium sp.]MBS5925612.1 hypothetical protein [Clostridium sp.]MBS5986181.1 hypothetical protein [Clostridium sp.]